MWWGHSGGAAPHHLSSRCYKKTKMCVCVAVGEDDQPGGDQLGSGSNFPLHRVSEETLKSNLQLLFWKYSECSETWGDRGPCHDSGVSKGDAYRIQPDPRAWQPLVPGEVTGRKSEDSPQLLRQQKIKSFFVQDLFRQSHLHLLGWCEPPAPGSSTVFSSALWFIFNLWRTSSDHVCDWNSVSWTKWPHGNTPQTLNLNISVSSSDLL